MIVWRFRSLLALRLDYPLCLWVVLKNTGLKSLSWPNSKRSLNVGKSADHVQQVNIDRISSLSACMHARAEGRAGSIAQKRSSPSMPSSRSIGLMEDVPVPSLFTLNASKTALSVRSKPWRFPASSS